MPCRHKPKFTFKQMFARRPEYICEHCEAKIQLTTPFRTGLRVANALFLMIVIFRAFSGTSGADGTLEGFLTSMGIVFALAAGYLLINYLIIRFAPYEEIYVEEETDEKAALSDSTAADGIDSQAEPDMQSADLGNYSEEQKQLMEMYAAYEKQAMEKELRENGAAPADNKPVVQAEPCVHVPVKSWKNYIPSKTEFVCGKCGEKVVFSMARKRSMNMMFLAIMAVVLMPNFFNENIDFLKYLLLTLAVLFVATLLQIYFVKKWPLETKNNP